MPRCTWLQTASAIVHFQNACCHRQQSLGAPDLTVLQGPGAENSVGMHQPHRHHDDENDITPLVVWKAG
jgi:hypothetical protein